MLSPTPSPTRLTAQEPDFTAKRAGWPDDPHATAWFGGGAYHILARYPGRHVAIRAPIDRRFGDVVLTAAFRKIGGPPGGGYGLIVRDAATSAGDGLDQSGRYYVLEAGDRGEIGVWRREGDRWVDLIPWTRTDKVRPGTEPNTLTVRAVGQRLVLEVNGAEVASVEDGAVREGAVGVFVGGDSNEVLLERFRVEALD